MDDFFQVLGKSVLARWRSTNFSLERFPEIAAEALEQSPPADQVEMEKLIEAFLLEDEQPLQSQSGFGEPELIVYENPHFYIQILFWIDGTTDIHQHQFSGAFHLLAGESIHATYEFQNAQSVSAHLRVGNLQLLGVELLETGRTVPITSGSGHIHALFHLERPSISVVIRTHHDPGTGPQFTYLPPHLAVDPFQADALTARRKQVLDLLEKLEHPSYPIHVAAMLRGLDFERGFFILQNAVGYLRSLGRWEEYWEIFRQRHEELAGYVQPTLNEIIRRDGLVEMRRMVHEPEHRFFLALLLNLSSRKDLLAMVEHRFPGKSLATVMRWVEELVEISEFGMGILDAEMPPELLIRESEETLILGVLYLIEMADQPKPEPFKQLSKGDLESLRATCVRSSLGVLV